MVRDPALWKDGALNHRRRRQGMTIALAIHGGCGVLSPADLSDEDWAGARAALEAA